MEIFAQVTFTDLCLLLVCHMAHDEGLEKYILKPNSTFKRVKVGDTISEFYFLWFVLKEIEHGVGFYRSSKYHGIKYIG